MTENVIGLSLDLLTHPGETIKEVLEDRNMSQEELAVRTGYSAKHISEVVRGKKDISSEFANRLEYALNIPASFWMNLQNNYDKETFEINNLNNVDKEELNILSDLKDIIKYCEKENIIECNSKKEITLLNMRKFLNLNNLCSIPNLPIQQVAFRGSKANKVNIYVLYAWQKICEYFTSKENITKSFDAKKLETKYEQIKSTMFLSPMEMVEKLKEIFSECGVAFEIVQHFKGAPVQGFIQKRKDKVILCMTIRQSFSDIFWFTLFHEVGHLINDDFKNQYIDYQFIDSKEEQQADNFAKNVLINQEDYDLFLENSELNITNIRNFAISQNVLPGIVIGRIENDRNDYSFMTQYREKYKWCNEPNDN